MTLPKTSVKSRLVGLYHKYKHLLILLYFVVYMAWFSYVEKNIKTHFHVVHVPLDDYIPFCEYFVIPYLLWFGYVAWGIAYMALHNKSDYYRLCTFLFTGMTLFLLISTVYPNGHYLRPIHTISRITTSSRSFVKCCTRRILRRICSRVSTYITRSASILQSRATSS